MLRWAVVAGNIHLLGIRYDHLESQMKRVPSTLSPVIAVDRKAASPLHKQIYDGYRAMILGGSLGPGQQVPSSRALADELRISRIPVLTAYAQLLAEGYFEARTGAGTFVCKSLPDQFAPVDRRGRKPDAIPASGRPISRRASLLPRYEPQPWLRGLGAFSISQPTSENFPFQVWARIAMRHCREPQTSALQYGNPLGFEPLREAICAYLRVARAVDCEPRQVMIVNGSQQALELSTRVLLDEGSAAWLEEPGYWLVRSVLAGAGCRPIPVPVDAEGLQVSAGIKLCRTARAAFVAPSHQYPLGATMSASRRLQLLDWAEKAGAWIVEDDYDSEYRYASMPIASLQGLDRNSRVIYIGTFSKTLFPSLRLGYVVVPLDLVSRFVTVRHAMDIAPAHLLQAVLTDFMREGHYARHIRRTRQLYAERRAALVSSLAAELGSSIEIVGAEAGMYIALLLPKGRQDQEISSRAAREGLWLLPLSPSYIGEKRRNGLVLGFGSIAAKEIPRAVQHLKTILDAGGRAPRRAESTKWS